MMQALTWRPEWGDPTWLGCLTFSAYLFSALLCGRTGWLSRPSAADSSTNRFWWGLAVVLLLLGVNKQLDLQSLLIEVGRRVAAYEGWYAYRRQVQAVFAAVITLGITGWLFWVAKAQGPLLKRHPLLPTGLLLIVFYIVIRVADLDHLTRAIGWKGEDRPVLGWLEFAGAVLVGFAAWTAAKSAKKQRSNNH